MSDVPMQSAQPVGGGSMSQKGLTSTNSRDLEDIDRELEAYLEEKRSGKSVGFNHNVDDQLSKLREKFGARATPTKESLKPSEIEIVKESPRDPSIEEAIATRNTAEASPSSASVQGGGASTPSGGPVLSHDELIRSLEEKYSKGESTNLPPKPKEQKVPPKQETPAEVGMDPKFLDLKESIEPIDEGRVEKLLRSAAALDSYAEQTLLETFLARFKRNKERKELYVKTETELEDELEAFIIKNTGLNPGTQNVDAAAGSIVKSAEGNEEKIKQNEAAESLQSRSDISQKQTSVSESNVNTQSAQTSAKSFDILSNQKERTEVPSATPNVETAPNVEGGSSMLEEKYKAYLSKVEKKPTVLVYDPNAGFVRRTVDPSDPSLTIAFSVESATNTVVVAAFDERNNELGTFKIPQADLDN